MALQRARNAGVALLNDEGPASSAGPLFPAVLELAGGELVDLGPGRPNAGVLDEVGRQDADDSDGSLVGGRVPEVDAETPGDVDQPAGDRPRDDLLDGV